MWTGSCLPFSKDIYSLVETYWKNFKLLTVRIPFAVQGNADTSFVVTARQNSVVRLLQIDVTAFSFVRAIGKIVAKIFDRVGISFAEPTLSYRSSLARTASHPINSKQMSRTFVQDGARIWNEQESFNKTSMAPLENGTRSWKLNLNLQRKQMPMTFI